MNPSAAQKDHLSDSEIAMLSRDPRFQAAVRTMRILAGAFCIAPFIYIAVAATGVIRKAAGPNPLDMWWVLLLFSVSSLGAMTVVARQVAARAFQTPDFETASKAASALLITILAFPESVVIWGLISPFFNAPDLVMAGLLCGGAILVPLVTRAYWPQCQRVLLLALKREQTGPAG